MNAYLKMITMNKTQQKKEKKKIVRMTVAGIVSP